jgi:hypothetical protein
MRRISFLLVLLLIITSHLYSQVDSIELIKEKTLRYETDDTTLIYPIFHFKNKNFSELVNTIVRKEFSELYDIDPAMPIRTALKNIGKDGLTELGYEIHLDDQQFFSFELYQEWLAAYPISGQVYFTFDKISGKRLTLDSLIIPSCRKDFQQLVKSMWKNSLIKYRKELKVQLQNGDIDSTDYELSLEYLKDDCLSSYSSENFKLTKGHIQIFFECGFPHVMLPLDPSGGITLSLDRIKNYLRPAYKP